MGEGRRIEHGIGWRAARSGMPFEDSPVAGVLLELIHIQAAEARDAQLLIEREQAGPNWRGAAAIASSAHLFSGDLMGVKQLRRHALTGTPAEQVVDEIPDEHLAESERGLAR